MITKVCFIIVIVVAAWQKKTDFTISAIMICTFEVERTSVQTDVKNTHKTTYIKKKIHPYTLVLSFNIIPSNEEFNKVEYLKSN